MLVVFIGPPGAGKGTQAQHLAEYLDVPHLSTGEMFREAITRGTELGRQIAPYEIDKGHLVPDTLVLSIVAERIQQPDCAGGCLLDGFPRTLNQAVMLDQRLEDLGRALDIVVELKVDDEELIRRLLRRAEQAATPRADDNLETIPTRLQLYNSLTAPVLEYYRQRGLLKEVDGEGTPEQVFERVRTAVDSLLGRS